MGKGSSSDTMSMKNNSRASTTQHIRIKGISRNWKKGELKRNNYTALF
jgi:hypothetical protein